MRARYLARLGIAPALLNFVINFAFGLVVFASSRDLIALDLVVGVTIAATLTAWGTHAKVARAGRAGHVPGLPATSPWRHLPRQPLVLALTVALAAAALLFVATLAWPLTSLSQLDAALFKGATCAIGAHLALVASGLRALVGAPDRTAEHAAAVAAARPGQPLESLDKGCLACTDRARGISVAPVWHLVIDGDISDNHLTRSLALLTERYPTLRTRVQAVDGVADHARDFRYVEVPPTDLLVLADGPIAEVRQRVFDDFIDLFAQPPMRVTRVRDGGQLHLLVQQHHAIADGRAFIGLLTDWAAILRALDEGLPLLTGVVGRRQEIEALGLPTKTIKRLRSRGFSRFLREAWNLWLRPLERLPWNRGRDYRGANRCVRMVVPAVDLEALRAVRNAANVSLNSLLTGNYLRAIKRWSTARNRPIERLVCEVIAETRPRDQAFVSFANHLSAYLAEVKGPALDALIPAAQAVHAAVAREAQAQAHLERAVFRAWGVHTVPIDALRKIVLDDAEVRAQVGFSNLYALPLPELAGRHWRARDVWVTTPAAPPHGIALTATHYNGRLSFNFNYKASVISEADVLALAETFIDELRTVGTIDAELVLH